jgi:hypothetical protein
MPKPSAPAPKTDYRGALDSPFGSGAPADQAVRRARRRRRGAARSLTRQVLSLPDPPSLEQGETRLLRELLSGGRGDHAEERGLDVLRQGGSDVVLDRLFAGRSTPGRRELLENLETGAMWANIRDQVRAFGGGYGVTPKPEGKLTVRDPSQAPTEVAGLNLDALLADVDRRLFPKANPGLNILKAPHELGRAFLEDPSAVTSTSLRTAKESIAGIPQAIQMLAEDPGQALEQIARDYEDRYGSLLEGDEHTFRERIKTDYGITPYALDAAALAGGTGQAAGAVSRVGAVGRLATRVERARFPLSRTIGSGVQRLHTTTTRERPRLRISAGETGTRAQRTSSNLFLAPAQHALDKRRARRFDREAEQAGLRMRPDGRIERIDGQEPARLRAVRPGPGEVLPYLSPRELPMLRRIAGRTERAHGRRKGNERLRLLSHGGQVEKKARKQIKRLDGREQDALIYAVELGLTPDNLEASVGTLERYRRLVVEGRRSEGEVLPFEPDELPTIDKILADPDRHITSRLRDVADQLNELELREAALDPDLTADRAADRRRLPFAMVAGIRRAPDADEFRGRIREIQERMVAAGRDPGDLVERFGGIADLEPADRVAVVRELERHLRRERTRTERAAAQTSEVRRKDVDAVRKRAEREDARLDHEISAWIRKEVQARPGRYESSADFQARVDRAIVEAGLEAPGYWEQSAGPSVRRSLKAIGSGVRGSARSKAFTGARLRAGRRSGDPEVFVNGLLRNVKRRMSWRHVVTTVNHAAFEWSRGRHGGGLTAREMRRELDRRHIPPDEVQFVNVRILEKRELDDAGLARGQVVDPFEETLEGDRGAHGGIHPDDLEQVHQGLVEATVSREQLLGEAADVAAGGTRGQALNRYVAVPTRDYLELAATLRPDGIWGRALDVLWKQKPARIMLGLANTAWLSFQMMSNGILSGLSGAVNPFDYVAAQRWFKSLTPEERLAIEPELGITRHHHHIGDQTHLGAATNARFVNAWRAFKQTKVMRAAHKGNPLDLMFRADEAQNNFFRRTVFYTDAKREAYKRMGASWRSIDGIQKKLMSILSIKHDGHRLVALGRHRDQVEQHAEHVREWLGDYLTYTSQERRTIARSVMFYGYLRFSLRLVFWTMPIRHPIMAAILGDLGRMGAQEIKQLLGVEPEENVPVSILAQAYFGTPAEIRRQDRGAGSINFGRMNPFLNAITQMQRPTQTFGLFSPLVQAEMDQVFQQSTFTGREWRIDGRPTPAESQRLDDYYGSWIEQLDMDFPELELGPVTIPGHEGSPRGRILQRQLLSLAQPFRLWEDATLFGSQSDDALPWSPRPMRFKDEEASRGTEGARRRAEQEGPGLPMLRRTLPLLGLFDQVGPEPTVAPIVLEREREKRGESTRRRRRRRGGGIRLGGGGSGQIHLGTGSSGTIRVGN